VAGSPMIEQLHCSIPTGMVMWISPSVTALSARLPSLIVGSISLEVKQDAALSRQPDFRQTLC